MIHKIQRALGALLAIILVLSLPFGYALAHNAELDPDDSNAEVYIWDVPYHYPTINATKGEPNNSALGDVNGDGHANSNDAALILRHVVGIDELLNEVLGYADADANGKVDSADAATILRYTVGIDTLPPTRPEDSVLKDKIIILDPGHGFNSVTGRLYGGSISKDGKVIYAEADYVLSFALATKALLETYGATVYLTRTDRYMVGNYVRVSNASKLTLQLLKDYDSALIAGINDGLIAETLMGIIDRYDYITSVLNDIIAQYNPANDDNGTLAATYYNTPYDSTMARQAHSLTRELFEYQKDERLSHVLYISLHTNASNTTRRGLVTYCMNNEYNAAYYNGYQYEKNHRLARLLNNSVSANTGLQKNSKIYVNDFFMLREHNIPAVLLEIGYHDNPLDREMLTSDNMPSLVARGILSGLLSYFE